MLRQWALFYNSTGQISKLSSIWRRFESDCHPNYFVSSHFTIFSIFLFFPDHFTGVPADQIRKLWQSKFENPFYNKIHIFCIKYNWKLYWKLSHYKIRMKKLNKWQQLKPTILKNKKKCEKCPKFWLRISTLQAALWHCKNQTKFQRE
jgi:hypothetical protein